MATTNRLTKREHAKYIIDTTTTRDYPEQGLSLEIKIGDEEYQDKPWDNMETYGSVSKWRDKDSKAPGECILYREPRPYGKCLFYDFAGAVAKARKEVAQYRVNTNGKTVGQYAAEAVEFEFEYLRAWANEEWTYVYYHVTLSHEYLGEIGSESCGNFDTYCAPGQTQEQAFAHINEAVRISCATLLSEYRKTSKVVVNA